MKGWTKIAIASIVMIVLIMIMQEFANDRCTTPFWRGFGIALGACR